MTSHDYDDGYRPGPTPADDFIDGGNRLVLNLDQGLADALRRHILRESAKRPEEFVFADAAAMDILRFRLGPEWDRERIDGEAG